MLCPGPCGLQIRNLAFFIWFLSYLSGFSIRFVKMPIGYSESKLNTNQGLEYLFEECVCVLTPNVHNS